MPSILTPRALQHQPSSLSVRNRLQSASSSRVDETYCDDGLTPRALNIRHSYPREDVPSPSKMRRSGPEWLDESQDITPPRWPLRVMNPDLDPDYQEYRRAAIYLPSPAQQSLQRVATPQGSISTQSSKSRFSSFGSDVVNTVRKLKSKRKASTASTKRNSPQNPLKAPPGTMSETSESADGRSRSVSMISHKSSIAIPLATPISVVAPFAHDEPIQATSAEELTPGGIAAAKLKIQSFTAIYPPDELHYSPGVTAWALVNIKPIKLLDSDMDYNDHGITSIANRAQLSSMSRGQIANLAIVIEPPQGFEVKCVMGRLQHRQVLMGDTWSAIFKLQPQQKVTMPKAIRNAENHHPDMFFATDARWASNATNTKPMAESEKLMEEVERMLTPERELQAHVQYSHNLLPPTAVVQESSSCSIRATTESERRQRQFYAQRGQSSRHQRRTSVFTTKRDLDQDLYMARTICAVLKAGVGAKWPKSGKGSIKYTGVLPKDALQLLHDFREAGGATLPRSLAEEMEELKEHYEDARKASMENSFTRKGLKVVNEVKKLARRAVPTSSTLAGRSSYETSFAESMKNFNPGRNTPEDTWTTLAPASQPSDDLATTLRDITIDPNRCRGVGKFFDNIVGRRKNARTDHAERASEEDKEIAAI